MTPGEMDLQRAEGWRPDDGDVLVGRVRNVDASWSDYIGGYYPLIVIEPEDGSAAVAVHCFHDVLRKRILMLKPRTGERIGIKYHGQTKTRDGRRTVSNYTVRIDGRDADADVWGAMSNPANDVSRGQQSQQTMTMSPEGFGSREGTPTTDADFTPGFPVRGPESEGAGPADDDIPF